MRPLWIVPLLSLGLGMAGGQELTGMVRIYVVSEIGNPVERATVRIVGSQYAKTVDWSGPATVELPYGVYTFTCVHRTLATSFKVVRVERPPVVDVICGLPLANPGQVAGDGEFSPFEISGRIAPPPESLFGRVKAVGIFTEDTADARVDNRGAFRLLLRNEGVYRLFVLYGNRVVHEQTLDLTYAMPRHIDLSIKAARGRKP